MKDYTQKLFRSQVPFLTKITIRYVFKFMPTQSMNILLWQGMLMVCKKTAFSRIEDRHQMYVRVCFKSSLGWWKKYLTKMEQFPRLCWGQVMNPQTKTSSRASAKPSGLPLQDKGLAKQFNILLMNTKHWRGTETEREASGSRGWAHTWPPIIVPIRPKRETSVTAHDGWLLFQPWWLSSVPSRGLATASSLGETHGLGSQ